MQNYSERDSRMAASLAKKLRAQREHEDDERHDLANYTELQATDLMNLAFSEPQEVDEPIRHSFIIGKCAPSTLM